MSAIASCLPTSSLFARRLLGVSPLLIAMVFTSACGSDSSNEEEVHTGTRLEDAGGKDPAGHEVADAGSKPGEGQRDAAAGLGTDASDLEPDAGRGSMEPDPEGHTVLDAGAVEAGASGPGIADAGDDSTAPDEDAGEPEATEPEAAEPEPVEPEAAEPEAAEPEPVESEPAESEPAEPGPAEPEFNDDPNLPTGCTIAFKSTSSDYCEVEYSCGGMDGAPGANITDDPATGSDVAVPIPEYEDQYLFTYCRLDGDLWRCDCSANGTNRSLQAEGVPAGGDVCGFALNLCLEDPHLEAEEQPRECDEASASTWQYGCDLSIECRTEAEYGGVTVYDTQYEYANCSNFEESELADCSCSTADTSYRFQLSGDGLGLCETAFAICSEAEVESVGDVSCEISYTSVSASGYCENEIQCAQDTVINGTELVLSGSDRVSCEVLDDSIYCSCLDTTLEVPFTSVFQGCEDAGTMCLEYASEHPDLVLSSGNGGQVDTPIALGGGVAMTAPVANVEAGDDIAADQGEAAGGDSAVSSGE